MSITDELREWTRTHTVNCSDNRIALVAISDRIDAEHEKALDEWKAEHGQMWLKGYSECHAELLEGNETLASDLERCGWIRLPKDADGVTLRVGDEIEYPNGARDTVRFATISPIGWAVNDRGWKPEAMRHYTSPTVEDVLREFADRYLDYEGIPSAGRRGVGEALMDEYAAMLRLKEDA